MKKITQRAIDTKGTGRTQHKLHAKESYNRESCYRRLKVFWSNYEYVTGHFALENRSIECVVCIPIETLTMAPLSHNQKS